MSGTICTGVLPIISPIVASTPAHARTASNRPRCGHDILANLSLHSPEPKGEGKPQLQLATTWLRRERAQTCRCCRVNSCCLSWARENGASLCNKRPAPPCNATPSTPIAPNKRPILTGTAPCNWAAAFQAAAPSKALPPNAACKPTHADAHSQGILVQQAFGKQALPATRVKITRGACK